MSNQEERYFEVIGTISKAEFHSDYWFDSNEALSVVFRITFSFEKDGEEKEELQHWVVAEGTNMSNQKEEYNQLCNIGKMLGTADPLAFVGKKVKLIFGGNYVSNECLVGIGEENGNLFVIPYYLLSCELDRGDSQFFYSKDEVLEVLRELEEKK